MKMPLTKGYRIEIEVEREEPQVFGMGTRKTINYEKFCVTGAEGMAQVMASLAFREDINSIKELRITELGVVINAEDVGSFKKTVTK